MTTGRPADGGGGDLPHSLKVATVWLLLGVAVFLGVKAFERRREEARFHFSGGVVELRRGADGHYHWPGRIGGTQVDFLVDTGATRSALPQTLARELGLEVVGGVQSQTAGGLVSGDLVRADVELSGGVRVESLPMVALAGLQGRPLLGMDILGKLRWQQRDGVLAVTLPD